MSVPFRFGGDAILTLRPMLPSERAEWYPPVGIDPPIAPARLSVLHRALFTRRAELDAEPPLPQAEFFKMYFGWLGSAEVNFGKNRDEFGLAHHALLFTLTALGLADDRLETNLAVACTRLYTDLQAVAALRGPRDYVHTVRDDTGRMWLELVQGVYVSELTEVASTSGGFAVRLRDGGISTPRECTFLFRRGELLGTAAVEIAMPGELVDCFLKGRVLCECHAELGDDGEPHAVFLSVSSGVLEGQTRFEAERAKAFDEFPIEGVSRRKRAPWSLYEIFAEGIVARLISPSVTKSLDQRCAALVRAWFAEHACQYQRKSEENAEPNVEPKAGAEGETKQEAKSERNGSLALPDFVSVHDLHLLLGHATALNRHIGAAVLTLFRGAMRSAAARALPSLARAPCTSRAFPAPVDLLRISDGRCRLCVWHSSSKSVLLALGLATTLCGALSLHVRRDSANMAALTTATLAAVGWACLTLTRRDCGLADALVGRRTVASLSEVQGLLGGEWRLILAHPLMARTLVPDNAAVACAQTGPGVALDVVVTVADAVQAGYEFAVADGGELGVRAPGGVFRKLALAGPVLRVIGEECNGRLWGFDAEKTSFAERVFAPSSAG